MLCNHFHRSQYSHARVILGVSSDGSVSMVACMHNLRIWETEAEGLSVYTAKSKANLGYMIRPHLKEHQWVLSD